VFPRRLLFTPAGNEGLPVAGFLQARSHVQDEIETHKAGDETKDNRDAADRQDPLPQVRLDGTH